MKILNKMLVVVAIAFLATIASDPVMAFGLPKTPSIGGSDTSSVDVDGLVSQNSGIVKRYQSALGNLLKAQGILADALGIDEAGQRASAAAESLGKGVADKEVLEKQTAVSTDTQKLITKKMAEGGSLNAESKKKFGQAIPPYAKGTLDGSLLVSDAVSYASNVSSAVGQLSSDPMGLMKLKDGASAGIYVGTKLPGLLKEWFGNTQSLITFGKKNNIDVSKAEGVLGEISL